MPTLAHYQDAAAGALKAGTSLVAFETVAEGLRQFPGDSRLRQLLALSLARSGSSRQANRLLHALVGEGHADEETVGMLARTYKDLWATAKEPGKVPAELSRRARGARGAHRAGDPAGRGLRERFVRGPRQDVAGLGLPL